MSLPDRPVMTIAEVASLLSVSPSTIRRDVAAGIFRTVSVRSGRKKSRRIHRRILTESVRQYLTEGTVTD